MFSFGLFFVIGAIVSIIYTLIVAYILRNEVTVRDVVLSLIISIGSWISILLITFGLILEWLGTLVIIKRK